MIKIGITGGIGSGKSIVCQIFRNLEIPVFTADVEGGRIMSSDHSVIELLTAKFGDDIYTADGELIREKIAAIIFNNSEAISFINSVVHPVVKKNYQEWFEKQISKYCIIEAAILFESGMHEMLDKIITVYAPEDIRIQRVMERDKISAEDVVARVRNQMSEEEKMKRSDFIITNDDRQLIIPQVIHVHNLLSD